MADVITTTTINRKSVWGDRRAVSATLAFDTGDYVTGGIPVTAAQFGLSVLDEIIPLGAALDVAATPSALLARWVYSASAPKIQLFESAGAGASLTEKPAEAMGTGATMRVLAIGY